MVYIEFSSLENYDVNICTVFQLKKKQIALTKIVSSKKNRVYKNTKYTILILKKTEKRNIFTSTINDLFVPIFHQNI